MDLLETGVRELGIYSESRLRRLRAYIAELELWNRRHNLVGAHGDDLIVRHVLDSLAGYAVIEKKLGKRSGKKDAAQGLKIADIGSGAGLPGIPLAIWLEEYDFSFVEKAGKRCGFLRNVLPLCGIANGTVVCSQVEQLRNSFDLCVFRALGSFSEYIGKLKRITPRDSLVIAFKGKGSTVESELEILGPEWQREGVYPVTVPFLQEERNIVVLIRI